MNEKEALTRVKTGNFNGGHGFDMQLLVDAVGTIGEMFKRGQISEVVQCKDCGNRKCDGRAGTIVCGITGESHSRLWFCADGQRKEG